MTVERANSSGEMCIEDDDNGIKIKGKRASDDENERNELELKLDE
jgi:hypothetical protein